MNPRKLSLICIVAALLAACTSGSSNSVNASPTSAAGIKNIEHILVLMQENRSYDSYFGQLQSAGQPNASAEPKTGNPNPTDATAKPIAPFPNPSMCETADLNHDWTGVHQEINGGKMDGFTAANVDKTDPTGARAMATYTPGDLPYYYQLAKTYGIGDQYFASVPGPTYPNRYYLAAGTSFGHINNAFPPAGGWPQKTVFEELDAANISWKIYASQVSPEFLLFKYVSEHAGNRMNDIAQYYSDAAAGTLPQVAFVEPIFIGTPQVENDEHPPANPQLGQQFVAKVVDALTRSPDWPSAALFVTWDEHGGYYDHVAPPAAPKPDDIAPILGPNDKSAQFDQYGVRVPVLVVSPWSRPHYVSHVVHDHTSILRTIELRFGLTALTRRDAAASPMTDFFNFSTASLAKAPSLLAPTVDQKGVAQCTALWGSKTLGL